MKLFFVTPALYFAINIFLIEGFQPFIASKHGKIRNTFLSESKQKDLSLDERTTSIHSLLQISSSHFISQALNTIVQLEIPNILGEEILAYEQILEMIHNRNMEQKCNADALLRCMRLLCTVDILQEQFRGVSQSAHIISQQDADDGKEENKYHSQIAFGLTSTGRLLQTSHHSSFASCVQHWAEAPLWNSWLKLPDYVSGVSYQDDITTRKNIPTENKQQIFDFPPFDRANDESADEYYGNHPQSLEYANHFVKLIHTLELSAIVSEFNWNQYSDQTVVDIGGYNGKLMETIYKQYPKLHCKCLDLPQVIDSIPSSSLPDGVELVPGDAMDPSTIPKCDIILMKHILDKSMWTYQESIQLLKSCSEALPSHGKVIIAEAVLPDVGEIKNTKHDQILLSMDAFFILVGRKGQRTHREWDDLASLGGFQIDSIIVTSAPSCSILVLSKK